MGVLSLDIPKGNFWKKQNQTKCYSLHSVSYVALTAVFNPVPPHSYIRYSDADLLKLSSVTFGMQRFKHQVLAEARALFN
jgi:hypothetical protein